MTLDEFIADVERRRRTITVYAAEDSPDVAGLFETRNVTVECESLQPGGPGGFLVVRDEHGFVGAVSLAALTALSDPDERAVGEDPSDQLRELLAVLDDTLFSSLDRRQLLATAREFEDRALRTGNGVLRVGFQRLAAMRDQLPTYERLGEKTDLDVHVYGHPDWTPPAIDGVTYHTDGTELGRYWFVAFDGGTDLTNGCALVAEERAPGEFAGFWTYDAELVGDILAYLEAEYG